MSTLSNIWAGMGSLLVRMPRPISRQDFQRLSRSRDVDNLRKDSQKVISDMNSILRKVSR